MPTYVSLQKVSRKSNIAAAWGGVSGVALKGNPDTGFVYKAQPSAHDAFFVAGLSKHTRSPTCFWTTRKCRNAAASSRST